LHGFFQGTKAVSGADEDLFENPLKCPLDLGPLASQSGGDLGVRCVLDKDFIVKNTKVRSNNLQLSFLSKV
jgi:hypothetical protein